MAYPIVNESLNLVKKGIMKFHDLLDNAKCYEQVRQLRWLGGVTWPHCASPDITRQGKDDTQPEKQRYRCKTCQRRFDDLTLLSNFPGRAGLQFVSRSSLAPLAPT